MLAILFTGVSNKKVKITIMASNTKIYARRNLLLFLLRSEEIYKIREVHFNMDRLNNLRLDVEQIGRITELVVQGKINPGNFQYITDDDSLRSLLLASITEFGESYSPKY